MPYSFNLPTTSALTFSAFLTSTFHPSLPFTATTQRAVLRDLLKKHKRLPPKSKPSHLTSVLSALEHYLPYVFAIDAGLSGTPVADEEINIVLERDIEVEWRTTLSSTIPGREPPRIKGKGLDYEFCYILHTVACVYTLLARVTLHALHASTTPTIEQRTGIITTATKYLLQSNSIHSYVMSRAGEVPTPFPTADISPSVQGALAAVALAEATLLAVLKDDPYPAVVAQDRNKNDKEWMVKAPEIPKVRAHLFARLCLAAAEHAGKAKAMLSSTKGIDNSLTTYVDDLRKTSRAKACRFFAIDAELGGKTGEGIAWLEGGKVELGYGGTKDEASKTKGLARLRKDWTERREDKKIERGGEWGSDAGRLEEARVIEMLEKKWNKVNDMVRLSLVQCIEQMLT